MLNPHQTTEYCSHSDQPGLTEKPRVSLLIALSFLFSLVVQYSFAATPESNHKTNIETQQITTVSGKVEGAVHEGVASFKGIPFAKAPVGELRWMPPQKPEPWTTPLKANTF